MKRLRSWQELARGAVIPGPGTAAEFETGDWRSFRPILDKNKCINCLICWIYCPDSAFQVEEEKVKEIDLRYCKGCGICAQVCPPKVRAITMVRELK
jgi:pyruvate ferredoxin oxidoreductase delta subunit